MFGILNRMIFWELLKVFLMSLIALTGLFLIAGLIQEASQRGLSPSQIFSIIPLLVPSTLPYTVPATTLFATCVVYGRLAHDNEVTAIKATGVNLYSILWPAIFLGLLTSGSTMGLYYHLIPATHQQLQSQLLADGEEVLYGQLRRYRAIRSPKLPHVLYVRDVQGKWLIDVIFKKRKKSKDTKEDVLGEYDVVARAWRAKLRLDRAAGVIYADMERGMFTDENNVTGYFQDRTFELDLPHSMLGSDNRIRPNDLVYYELASKRAEVERDREPLVQRAEESSARLARTPNPPRDWILERLNLANKVRELDRLILALDAEVQCRPAIALGCLCFVLVGCPVGLWASRADYLSTFVICFLPTLFVYYPLLLCGNNLAREGRVPIVPAIWFANATLFLISGLLIWRLMRR